MMTWRRLLLFEGLIGYPTALKIFIAHLGWKKLLQLFPKLVWNSVILNPYHSLPQAKTLKERFSRHQLKPVVNLYETLCPILGQQKTLEFLKSLVSQSGAQFVAYNIPLIDANTWHSLAPESKEQHTTQIIRQFFNAEGQVVEHPLFDFSFDVKVCHFVQLTAQLGRPELAPLFCAADGAFFNQEEVPIALYREHTLAKGDSCCSFRFRFKEDSEVNSHEK